MPAVIQVIDERLITLLHQTKIPAHPAFSSLAQKDCSHLVAAKSGLYGECEEKNRCNPFRRQKTNNSTQHAVHYGKLSMATL